MTLKTPRGVVVFVFALLMAGPAFAMQMKAPVGRGQGGGVRAAPINFGANLGWTPMKMSFKQENFGGVLPSVSAPKVQKPAADGLPASAITDFQTYQYEMGRVPEEGFPLGVLKPNTPYRSEQLGFSEGISVLQGWSEAASSKSQETHGRESRGFKDTSLVMKKHLRRVGGIRSGSAESAGVFGRRIEEIMVGGVSRRGGDARTKHVPGNAGGVSAHGVFSVSRNGLMPAKFDASSQDGPVAGAVPGVSGYGKAAEVSPRAAVRYSLPGGVPLVVMVVGEKLGFSLFSRPVHSPDKMSFRPVYGEIRSVNLKGERAQAGYRIRPAAGRRPVLGPVREFVGVAGPAADAVAGAVMGHLAVPMPDLTAMVEGYALPLPGAAHGFAANLSFGYAGLTPSDFVLGRRDTRSSWVPEALLPLAGRSAGTAAVAFLFLGLFGPLPLPFFSRS